MQTDIKNSNNWQDFIAFGKIILKKSYFGTAMDPILILSVLVFIPCLILFAYTQIFIFLIIAILPVLYFFRAYDFYMKHDRKMLRTERHEETMLRIASVLGNKGNEMPESRVDSLPGVSAKPNIVRTKPKLLMTKRNQK